MRILAWVAFALIVAGCRSNPEPRLPANVSSHTDASVDLKTIVADPARAWDYASGTIESSPETASKMLETSAKELFQNAVKQQGPERGHDLDDLIVRVQGVLPRVSASASDKGIPLRMILAEAAYHSGDNRLASESANSVLAASTDSNDWTYGGAQHDMNLVLAGVAFRSQNPNEARRRVMQASRTPGSPELDTLGPHFGILYDIVRSGGDRTMLLDYLEAIQKFWKSDLPEQWLASLKTGKEPTDALWKQAISR